MQRTLYNIFLFLFNTALPTTSKKEVRFDGEQKEVIPRSRTHSGTGSSSRTRSSGRRRKGSRQRKHASEHRLTDHQLPSSSKHKHEHHRKSSRSSRNSNEPCTSAQAKMRDGHHHDSETSSLCSTCSSSSSESDDFAYKLPQRKIYGGVRISYVPNDALACARRKEQQQLQQKKEIQPQNTTNKKFLSLFNFK